MKLCVVENIWASTFRMHSILKQLDFDRVAELTSREKKLCNSVLEKYTASIFSRLSESGGTVFLWNSIHVPDYLVFRRTHFQCLCD
jgi:hypothetical protein